MADASSDIVVTGPNVTWRVTQLDSGAAEGLGDCDALGIGLVMIFRCAPSRTIRMVTASPTARPTNRMLASTGCSQGAVRRVPGTQAGGTAETSPLASR